LKLLRKQPSKALIPFELYNHLDIVFADSTEYLTNCVIHKSKCLYIKYVTQQSNGAKVNPQLDNAA
jgi:hypothetical protein